MKRGAVPLSASIVSRQAFLAACQFIEEIYKRKGPLSETNGLTVVVVHCTCSGAFDFIVLLCAIP